MIGIQSEAISTYASVVSDFAHIGGRAAPGFIASGSTDLILNRGISSALHKNDIEEQHVRGH